MKRKNMEFAMTAPRKSLQRVKKGYRKRVMPAASGYTRKVGFYGRFSGPGHELKFFDTAHSFNIDNTGEVPATGQLNIIPQGISQSERLGRKATIKSIQTQLQLTYVPGAATTGVDCCYIWLILDSQCNGQAAALSDVFSGTATTPSELRINMANSDRFRILKKWVIPMVSQAGVSAAYGRVIKRVQFYKKCSIDIDWDATAATGAVATTRSNNLFLIAAANEDDATSVSGFTRLRYTDQ